MSISSFPSERPRVDASSTSFLKSWPKVVLTSSMPTPAQPEKGFEVQLDGMGEQEGDGRVGMGHLCPCMVQ